MPNYVANVIEMQGIGKLPLYRESEDDRTRDLDFNVLAPMPETLLVTRAVGTSCEEGEAARDMFRKRTFDQIMNLARTGGMSEAERNGLLQVVNTMLYGEKDWYDWAVCNWGTKWNAFETVISDDRVAFWTAWSEPTPLFVRLSEMFPEREIRWSWAEEQIGLYAGYVILRNGEIIEEYKAPDCSEEACEIARTCWGDELVDEWLAEKAADEACA